MTINNAQNMACFKCISPTCRVSRCPHPKDNARIKKNLEARRKSKKINGKIGNYSANLIENMEISTEDIGEIFLTQQLIERNSANNNNQAQPDQPISSQDSDSSKSEHGFNHRQLF